MTNFTNLCKHIDIWKYVKYEATTLYQFEILLFIEEEPHKTCRPQRCTQNEAKEAMPPPPEKNLWRFFAGVLYQSQLFENNGRNSRIHVASCSLIEQRLGTWIFATGCENIRLKYANLLAKLPIIADNTTRGAAWMKCKGAAFLQKSTNSDETFLRGIFAWSIAEPNRNILGQDMTNPKRTTQRSVMQQHSVSHSTVGIVVRGVTRLASARGKKQVWRTHVRTWDLSDANLLCWRKYLWHFGDFSAPLQWFGARGVVPLRRYAPDCGRWVCDAR